MIETYFSSGEAWNSECVWVGGGGGGEGGAEVLSS